MTIVWREVDPLGYAGNQGRPLEVKFPAHLAVAWVVHSDDVRSIAWKEKGACDAGDELVREALANLLTLVW